MQKETRRQPQIIGGLVEDYYNVVRRSLVAASAMHRDVAAAISNCITSSVARASGKTRLPAWGIVPCPGRGCSGGSLGSVARG
jgi:hypothetical protein